MELAQEALSCVWEFDFTPGVLEDQGGTTSADDMHSADGGYCPFLRNSRGSSMKTRLSM